MTYLRISAYSYPALAIYNAGAALYRSMAKNKVTMYISFAVNIIDVVGNIIGVYVLIKNWKLTMIQKISLNLMERCSNVF